MCGSEAPGGTSLDGSGVSGVTSKKVLFKVLRVVVAIVIGVSLSFVVGNLLSAQEVDQPMPTLDLYGDKYHYMLDADGAKVLCEKQADEKGLHRCWPFQGNPATGMAVGYIGWCYLTEDPQLPWYCGSEYDMVLKDKEKKGDTVPGA